MANEIQIDATLAFEKSGVSESLPISALKVDVAGSKYTKIIQTIGVTEEAIDLGDSGVGGYMLIRNMDATNFVTLRPGTGTADLIKLIAGDIALFRMDIAPWAIADTGSVDVEFLVVEA